jgi:hypothetical protein
MNLRTNVLGVALCAAVGLAAGDTARANGAEFFEAQNDGRVVLYYFGNVKDSKGNALDDFMVVVQAKNVSNAAKNGALTFKFRRDVPGHFKSVDVGVSIEGVGGKVDPAQISITVEKDGYKLVKAPSVPNKMGGVDLGTFILDPIPGAVPAKKK